MTKRDWLGVIIGATLLIGYVSYNLGQDVALDEQGTTQRVQMLINAAEEPK